jgi:hypothetical protein
MRLAELAKYGEALQFESQKSEDAVDDDGGLPERNEARSV